jgi:hypothetical protein
MTGNAVAAVTEHPPEDLVGAEAAVEVGTEIPSAHHDAIAVTEMIDAVETVEIVMTVDGAQAVIVHVHEIDDEPIGLEVVTLTARNVKEMLLAAANVYVPRQTQPYSPPLPQFSLYPRERVS